MNAEVKKMQEEYKLDEGIADLVYQFNRLGLKTLFSCQGHEWYKKPYIIFGCDEENLQKILLTLYEKFSKNSHYLDIGEFYKKCTPMISESGAVIINDNWAWEGRYWDLTDYESKIKKLVSYLEKL